MDLSLANRTEGDKTVVSVGGEIDVYTAPKLREQIVTLVEEGHYHLVIDMEDVEFLDSTGLGVLVGGLKRVRAHDGSLRLVCTQERILKIFRITGLTKVFPIHDNGRRGGRGPGLTVGGRGWRRACRRSSSGSRRCPSTYAPPGSSRCHWRGARHG